MYLNKLSFLLRLFLGFSILLLCIRAEALNDIDKITPDISIEEFRGSLASNPTVFLSTLLNDKKARESYLRDYYTYKNLEAQFNNLNPQEKEAAIAELVLRKTEIMRRAVVDAVFQAEKKDFEMLAKEIYLTDKEKYKTRRKIKISQIFLEKKSSPNENEEVKKLASEILSQLEKDNLARHNANTNTVNQDDSKQTVIEKTDNDKDLFAELAKKYSQDANASLGGFDSRWFIQPETEPTDPVVKAAFSLLARGEITGVIEGKHGYHILRLMEYDPNRQQEFDEVKDQILTKLKEDLWAEKDKQVTAKLLPPKDLTINDELAAKIIKEVYDSRDESLKKNSNPLTETTTSAQPADASATSLPAPATSAVVTPTPQ